ncbi:deoxyribodipyrimidine photo-lyase [Enhydrobacter aerosaccus]|uniref:Deoxyribodipyrimidine photo-lyase n=1 Tax=Enhydrobacter aerosaccus TaxID=225324 RepID=A0A1T4S2J6_9HYPH|nr:deoxyribodipyrimidine photo-lyase [Enhydrobacter aerosaccus]SKA22387.1 deoxyribodipyrimidine photo-lyase [Enhydrobacter aerosaccus]
MTSLVWFRNDLRLADNPALMAALGAGEPIVPVYVLDEETEGKRSRGAASRWWLHHSLAALDSSLWQLGSRLILHRGSAEQAIGAIASACGASTVYWNRVYDQGTLGSDHRLKRRLQDRGITVGDFRGDLLFEPWEVKTGSGGPFKVFTPFWKACQALPPPSDPLPAPRTLPSPASWPASDRLDNWRLLPAAPDWSGGLKATWSPGEATAIRRLAAFLEEALAHYQQCRDKPACNSTSRLSPHLAFGEISPRQIWHAVRCRGASPASDKFLAELGWREFSYHLLFHFSDLTERNFRAQFDAFPWLEGGSALEAWRRGHTGYPIVDAGMRQLWETGWMHNRVRMITASFLTKHLLVDWRQGERWFWDTLVDADPANNAASWQWVAGCGADAAPYFRIFNPILQAEKFDPNGEYVRRWVPELANLPAETIHRPWMARLRPSLEIYPPPIVEHSAARTRALQAFRSLAQAA